MNTTKERIERRTGLLWGVGRTAGEMWDRSAWVRFGGGESAVKFEVGLRGRFFYLTWGLR